MLPQKCEIVRKFGNEIVRQVMLHQGPPEKKQNVLFVTKFCCLRIMVTKFATDLAHLEMRMFLNLVFFGFAPNFLDMQILLGRIRHEISTLGKSLVS